MRTKKHILWSKTGDHEGSGVVVYASDRGGWTILRTRIAGQWTRPALYRDGKFTREFDTVADAKDWVERQERIGARA